VDAVKHGSSTLKNFRLVTFGLDLEKVDALFAGPFQP
jgi:hypothetical protein